MWTNLWVQLAMCDQIVGEALGRAAADNVKALWITVEIRGTMLVLIQIECAPVANGVSG